MRILVCGGRDFADVPIRADGNGADKEHPSYKARWAEYEFVCSYLDNFCVANGLQGEKDQYGNWLPVNVTIISGKARGADTAAINWAIINWVDFVEFPADWEKNGKAAGPIRNQQMLDEGKPDVVIAFPGGNGTADMVSRARKSGIKIHEVAKP